MPTRMGGYLNGLIFLMFLLSVGYSNNLLLIFTLFLFGFNLMWVIQTHFHLQALKLQSVQVSSGHAQEPMAVSIHWSKTPDGPMNWVMGLVGQTTLSIDSFEHGLDKSQGQITIDKRGVYEWTHLKIKTEMPFGLYTAWIYLPASVQTFAYPAKLKNLPAIVALPSRQEGEHSSLRKGPHEIAQLGPYAGEESKRISWKHYARSGELMVKEGEDLVRSEVEFRLLYNEENKEYFLSKLATQMVQCSKTDTPFSFIAGTRKFPAGLSEKHLNDCLKELARC